MATEIQKENNRKAVARYRANNPDKVREAARRWRIANPEKARDNSLDWASANPDNVRESNRRWRSKNKEHMREYQRRRYASNPNKQREADRRWQAKNPEKAKAARRSANGQPEPTRPIPATCECCGGQPGERVLCLDHCHETGRFRGWICHRCNLGIGHLGDSVTGLQNALNYLLRE